MAAHDREPPQQEGTQISKPDTNLQNILGSGESTRSDAVQCDLIEPGQD